MEGRTCACEHLKSLESRRRRRSYLALDAVRACGQLRERSRLMAIYAHEMLYVIDNSRSCCVGLRRYRVRRARCLRETVRVTYRTDENGLVRHNACTIVNSRTRCPFR